MAAKKRGTKKGTRRAAKKRGTRKAAKSGAKKIASGKRAPAKKRFTTDALGMCTWTVNGATYSECRTKERCAMVGGVWTAGGGC